MVAFLHCDRGRSGEIIVEVSVRVWLKPRRRLVLDLAVASQIGVTNLCHRSGIVRVVGPFEQWKSRVGSGSRIVAIIEVIGINCWCTYRVGHGAERRPARVAGIIVDDGL